MAFDWGPVCMTMIGLGYLFPIAAVWAAFDYWKELFPTTNVEFTVTCVYQVGSVATVMLLSLTKGPFALAPRITVGMAGQFICLGAIMCFRWVALQNDILYWALLFLVLAVSIATGFLDSALLALCSQYDSRMQSWLQLGIGLGTLVSVVYRDTTKLLIPGDVEDGTAAYFAVAIVTIAACYGCYRLLMALPVSRHVIAADELAMRGGEAREPFQNSSSHASSCTPRLGAHMSPHCMEYSKSTAVRELAKAEGADSSGKLETGESAGEVRFVGNEFEGADFSAVFEKVWKNQCTVFLNLFLTTACYPGIITAIPCRNYLALKDGEWFQTLLLTAFTFADMFGRLLTGRRFGLTHSNIWLTIVARGVVFPIMLVCAILAVPDLFSFFVVAVFGFLNGFCVSLSLIVINEIPGLSDEQRKTCGRISACAVNGGLCVGSIGAACLAAIFRL